MYTESGGTMKFSEMPYKRIDMEEVEKEYKSIIERTKNAKSGSTINLPQMYRQAWNLQ